MSTLPYVHTCVCPHLHMSTLAYADTYVVPTIQRPRPRAAPSPPGAPHHAQHRCPLMSAFNDFTYDPDVCGGHDPCSPDVSDDEWDRAARPPDSIEWPEADAQWMVDSEGSSTPGLEYDGNDSVTPPTYEEAVGSARGVDALVGAIMALETTEDILMVMTVLCARYAEVDARVHAQPNYPDLLACQAQASLPVFREEMEEWIQRRRGQ